MQNQVIKQNLPLALFLVIVATLSYAAMGIFAKLAMVNTPINIILFIRFSILFICVLPLLAKSKFKVIRTKNLPLHILRAVCAVLAITLTFTSIQYIPLAMAIVLSSTEPLFVPVVFRISRGVKIVGKIYWGICIGLLGIIILMNPSIRGFHFAALLALGAGILRSISVSTVRTLTKSDPVPTIMFYFFFLGTCLTGVSTIFSWHDVTSWSWRFMILIGITSFIFQYCLTSALKHAQARIISPCCYLAVLFTAIADWLLWGQILTIEQFYGMVLIVLGAVITVWLGKSLKQSD